MVRNVYLTVAVFLFTIAPLFSVQAVTYPFSSGTPSELYRRTDGFDGMTLEYGIFFVGPKGDLDIVKSSGDNLERVVPYRALADIVAFFKIAAAQEASRIEQGNIKAIAIKNQEVRKWIWEKGQTPAALQGAQVSFSLCGDMADEILKVMAANGVSPDNPQIQQALAQELYMLLNSRPRVYGVTGQQKVWVSTGWFGGYYTYRPVYGYLNVRFDSFKIYEQTSRVRDCIVAACRSRGYNLEAEVGDLKSAGYYDPSKPTVVYVHGYSENTTFNVTRENVPDASYWKSQGWNVALFYWNQFADEGPFDGDIFDLLEDTAPRCVAAAQEKIYTTAVNQNNRAGMRWHTSDPSSPYSYFGSPSVGVARLFRDSFLEAFKDYNGPSMRFVGHSLGHQLALELAKYLHVMEGTGPVPFTYAPGMYGSTVSGNITISKQMLPKRLELLDPYVNDTLNEPVEISRRNSVEKNVMLLNDSFHLPMAVYETSQCTSNLWKNNLAKHVVWSVWRFDYIMPGFIVDPGAIGKREGRRHAEAVPYYFKTLRIGGFREWKAKSWVLFDEMVPGAEAPSAACTDDRMMAMYGASRREKFVQFEGMGTGGMSDDKMGCYPK